MGARIHAKGKGDRLTAQLLRQSAGAGQQIQTRPGRAGRIHRNVDPDIGCHGAHRLYQLSLGQEAQDTFRAVSLVLHHLALGAGGRTDRQKDPSPRAKHADAIGDDL
jgi:hypothetical protein